MIEQSPIYLVTSTANFISITEKFVKDNFMDPEAAVANAIEREKKKMIADGVDIKKVMEDSKKGREYPQEEVEAKGFYKTKKEVIEAEKISQGTFYLDKGKMYFGSADTREPVSYSNWYAGNVDPEQLERHKNLLDRQHFGGPTWENRPMPKSVLDETFQQYLTGIEDIPAEKSPKERGLVSKDSFEKVKR